MSGTTLAIIGTIGAVVTAFVLLAATLTSQDETRKSFGKAERERGTIREDLEKAERDRSVIRTDMQAGFDAILQRLPADPIEPAGAGPAGAEPAEPAGTGPLGAAGTAPPVPSTVAATAERDHQPQTRSDGTRPVPAAGTDQLPVGFGVD